MRVGRRRRLARRPVRRQVPPWRRRPAIREAGVLSGLQRRGGPRPLAPQPVMPPPWPACPKSPPTPRPSRRRRPGPSGRRVWQAHQGRIPDAYLPLGEVARQERNRDRNFINRDPRQQLSDLVDLRSSARRARDAGRGRDDLGQEHTLDSARYCQHLAPENADTPPRENANTPPENADARPRGGAVSAVEPGTRPGKYRQRVRERPLTSASLLARSASAFGLSPADCGSVVLLDEVPEGIGVDGTDRIMRAFLRIVMAVAAAAAAASSAVPAITFGQRRDCCLGGSSFLAATASMAETLGATVS